MNKYSRFISLLLILCLMSGLGGKTSKPSFTLSDDIYSRYKQEIESNYTAFEINEFRVLIDNASEYKGKNEDQGGTLYKTNVSIEQILYYLVELKGNMLESADGTKKLNPYIYKKYKVVAYDDIEIIMKNKYGYGSVETIYTEEGKEVEYRYLGYTVSSDKITNDFYPSDFKSTSNPLTRTYKINNEAMSSWKTFKLKPHYGQLYQLLNTKLKNDDITDGQYRDVNYTGFDLLGLNGFPSYSGYLGNPDIKTAQSKVVKMQEPSLGSIGQFKLVHGASGRYYDTFRTQEMTLSAKVFIEPKESVYFIAKNQEEVTIDYDVKTVIDDAKTSLPYSNGLNISKVAIRSEGRSKDVFLNEFNQDKVLNNTLSTGFTKTIKVSDLDLKSGKDVISIEAISEYTDMAQYTVLFRSQPVEITLNAATDFMADFRIYNPTGDDVTDGLITLKDLYFVRPVTVSLSDASTTSRGNIVSRKWYVLMDGTYVPLDTTNKTGFDFTVTRSNKESVLNGNRLSFKLEVMTDMSTETEVSIHEVTFKKSLPPVSLPRGPEAVIKAKLKQNSNGDYLAMEGQVFNIHGRASYHPDGLELEKYEFETNGGHTASSGGKKNDYIYYLDAGSYSPSLTVTDEKNARGSDSTSVKVKSAVFKPIISIEGSKKENRKLTFSVKNEYSLKYFPIDLASLEWTITPLDNQGDVIRVDGPLRGAKEFDLLFKKKGSYQIKVTGDIFNGFKRYTGTETVVLTIAEDLPPVSDFTVSSHMVRNVQNNNMTEIIISDHSMSLDGDFITQRKYWYRYDEDNDGDFGDTDWILLSAGNFKRMSAFTDQVGSYEFKIEAKEGFGQATISKFILDTDYKRANTDHKPLADRQTEIINIAPTVGIEVTKKKPLKIIAYHDFEGGEFIDFKNKLDILKARLQNKQIDMTVDYLTPTEIVGNREVYTTYFDTFISVTMHVKGKRSHYSWSNGGDDYDVDELQTFNLYLDSFSSEGSAYDLRHPNKNRFQIVDVSFGNSGRKYYEYKNRSYDYSEFDYRQIHVTYKDNGIEKKATYNFVYDWEEYSKYDGDRKEEGFDYYEYKISSYKLHEDKPFIERPEYVELNSQFAYGYSPRPTISKPTNTRRKVDLKIFDKFQLESIIKDYGDGDVYFLNLCSQASNRLALNEDMVMILKDNDMTYLTLESDMIKTNPMIGNFDDLIVGQNKQINWSGSVDRYLNQVKRVFVTIGNLLYELDQESKHYIFRGLAENAEDYRYIGNDMVRSPDSNNVYVQGYLFEGNRYYGVEALTKKLIAENKYFVEVWGQYNNFEDAYEAGTTAGGKWDFVSNWIDESIYNNHCGKLTLMPDGNLVGYKLFMDNYYPDGEFTKRAVVYDTGYIGKIEVDGFTSGFVHSNGNVVFKEGNGSFYYQHENKLIVIEGIDNIRHMKYSAAHNALYVYTDNTLVKYDTVNNTRSVINDSFTERKGTSIKIGDNKWMIGEKVYEGYKEIYTTDLDGEKFRYSYRKKGRTRYSDMKYSLKLYIDENDNLYEEIYKYDPPRYDVMSKKLLATNVKSLPFMGEITKLPGPENITSDKKYNYCKTYIDKNDYLYSTSQGRLLDTPVENIKYIGEAFSDSYWTNTYYTALISLKDGRIGIHDSEKLKYLKAINYANLTIGSKEKLISDTELLNTSSRSDYFQNQDDLLNKIYSSYDHYKSSTSLYVVVGESMNITTNFDDFEGDEAYSQLFDFIHEDPNYFENSLGRDPSAGSGLESPLTHLDYVGHYVLKPRMKDNPKDDDRFHEYRLENENEARFDVYSHRRPVALMDFKFGENLSNPAYFTLRCMDAGSYDLDHLSQADKGIIKRRFSIKGANDPNWTRTDQGAFTYLKIEKNVDYTVVYEVMDYEGEWSEKLVKQFNLSELPINLKAKIKTKNPAFSIDALPSSEIFSIYDIETEYSKDLKLEIALYDGEIRKGNLITVPFVEGGSGHRDSANTNLIKWKERDLQVPPTLADKAYKLRVTAIDIMNPDKRAVLEFDVAVRTPINLYGEVSPEELQSGESYSLKAFTSKYASQVSVKAFKDTPKEETILLALEGPPLGQMKKWIKDQSVPSLLEGEYDFEFIATTPNGNYESVLVKKKTQNIKLYDFNVHYVSDYDMESMFSGGKKYMVKDLPLDKTDGLLMKMGYAFYFSLKSKGLAKAGDFIKITPKFTDPLGNALDMYYSDGDHESILGLSSSGIKDAKDKFRLYYSGQCLESEYLGSFSSVVIKNDLKSLVGDEEHWKGRYGLPMSAVFTRSGVAPSSKNLYKGPVTVNFEIQGIKDGSVAYDYKASSTWEKERTNAYGHPLNVTKYNTYFIGDVIVVDPSKTSKSDYTAKPVF